MIMDRQLQFSDSQVVTATAISTDVVDLGSQVLTRNIGGSNAMFLVVQTDALVTDAGSDATLTVTLESDSVVGLGTSPTIHYSSGALPFATYSPAGTTILVVALPFGQYERYMGVRYTIAAGPLTGGSFSAFLTRDPEFWQIFQANNPQAHSTHA